MTDIFISYASQDRERIQALVQALEQTGWSIFWDRTIPTGKTWREYIGTEIETCRAMIVVWSETSVASDWVQDEAAEGKRRRVLFPVRIDDVAPPFGYRGIQAADLIGWTGAISFPAYDRLVSDLAELLGSTPVSVSEAEAKHKEEAKRVTEEEHREQAEKDAKRKAEEEERRLAEPEAKPEVTRQTADARVKWLTSVVALVLIGGAIWYAHSRMGDTVVRHEVEKYEREAEEGHLDTVVRLEVEKYELEAKEGHLGREDCNGGSCLTYINDGEWIGFSEADLGTLDKQSFRARVASKTEGGEIHVRRVTVDGETLTTCPVPGTGSWSTFTTVECKLNRPISGKQTIYLLFRGSSRYLFNIDWIEFRA